MSEIKIYLAISYCQWMKLCPWNISISKQQPEINHSKGKVFFFFIHSQPKCVASAVTSIVTADICIYLVRRSIINV